MSSSLDLFKPSNFVFDFATKQKFTFFIQEASLPGLSIGSIPLGHFTQNTEQPGDNLTWEPLSLTLLVDEDFTNLILFHKYLLDLKDPETGSINLDKAYFDGSLFINTNKNNIHFVYKFYTCWISDMSAITLSTTSNDDPITFSVTIKYSYYKILVENT